ncbi:MAG: NAD+ synthase [Actinobacteria bacterium]|uniref:NAD(+) synthase (glutamine-hydrolyzing) n=1 Tax=freshwater metagenome TaxID=449393 RepID=A0A6J6PEX5_9ZZZZ|nr:NAD+ synthase [Actinomycetota bacterium]MSX33604.1 NAD+ synthase [Actinomycetota bacterium]MSX95088.1 NAD+ synthase [Actinomycetota bacterium]MSY24412.1 NAD+ synthase [Actinomycetota bacterium]MSY33477.1 NAD+ synthase [Actinomycetota bacterium]
MPTLRVGLAQLNTVVGDIDGNASRIIELIAQASASGCDVVAFPELAITGYPPEDLLLRSGFVADVGRALERIVASTGTCTAIVGYVEQGSETRSGNDAHDGETTGARTASRSALYNAAAVCRDGSLISNYRKRELPNYSVFDEARYFVPGEGPLDVFDVNGVSVGVSICEDAWTVGGPIAELGRQNTQLVVNINASPFNVGKSQERAAVIAERAKEASATIVYVNQVGGQDELVFDGDSLVMSPVGSLLARAPRFIEDLYVIDLEFSDVGSVISQSTITPLGVAKPLSEEAEVWEALVLATRDFVAKNRFSDVVIGLSGGVDSAIVAAIAVDAVGADHVHGVLMPSRYSSDHSISDAVVLAENLGVDYCTIAIEPGHVALMEMLASSYDGKTIGLAEENLQSRLRAVTLMGLSNAFGWLLLNTGNKSESSVGYSTLYGDSAGGYAVIKDVSKLLVYRLCRYRNERAGRELIPENVLVKPPSAELRPDQRDDQSLPPYEELDPILAMYVEGDHSIEEIIAAGHNRALVERIVGLVDLAEYKRRQSPPGPRVTSKAFGKDRRLPIVNRYRR